MKTLISAQVVRNRHAEGQTDIVVSASGSIVTPEARSVAAALGVRLVDAKDSATAAAPVTATATTPESAPAGASLDPALRDLIRTQVMAKLPPGHISDAELNRMIDKAAKNGKPVIPENDSGQAPAMTQSVHYQAQCLNGIKRIDAASIDFSAFSGARDGSVGVADVITAADNSPMTAGYMTWTQCFFPWDLAHDEINVVLEGQLHIRTDGQELVCQAGDAVFIPKGSRLEIGTLTSTRFLYITYPALDPVS